MALSQAVPRLVALPGAAGASFTERFKELLVMLVMSLRGGGGEDWSPGAEETVQETGKGNRLGRSHRLREKIRLS